MRHNYAEEQKAINHGEHSGHGEKHEMQNNMNALFGFLPFAVNAVFAVVNLRFSK